MQLLRFALLGLGKDVSSWDSFALEHEEAQVVSVESYTRDDRPHRVVAAQVPLDTLPAVTGDAEVEVPSEPRQRAESAIELTADLLAVGTAASCIITSPPLVAAFLAEGEKELAWLQTKAGIVGFDQAVARPRFNAAVEMEQLRGLTDRRDGVALLAEAFGHSHLTGRYHELLRLFECAFAESAGRLVPPLAQFLEARAALGFTKTEVKRWIVGLRGPATHADRNPFSLEAKLRGVVERMSLAAYEVLFNKANWHSKDSDRRQIWTPAIGPLDAASETTFVRQAATVPLVAQILDRFGVFPLDLSAPQFKLSSNCWPDHGPATTMAPQGQVRVVPTDELSRIAP